MMCIAKTRNDKPCKLSPNKKYCHVHRVNELNKSKLVEQRVNLNQLNKKVVDQRNKIGDLVIENNNLKNALEEANDKLEIAKMENEQMKKDLSDYNFIRYFESIFDQVKRITKTKDVYIIKDHLLGKHQRTHPALCKLLCSQAPYDVFNTLREKRNRLAHKKDF